MKLTDYFTDVTGTGVLATADAEGRVDSAVYARPKVLTEDTVAFLMRERLTYSNLRSNPYASFLFLEDGQGYRGIRLYLKKLREDQDPKLLDEMTRCWLTPSEDEAKGPKYVVYFSVDKVLPLIGDTWKK